MYYHGTTKSNGTAIISEQKMKSSRGDDHWLGDGCYFYKDDFYAYRWIAIEYTKNFTNKKNIDYIFNHYTILKANINLSPSRIYSLSDPVIHIHFLELLDLLEEKQQYSERFKAIDIVDGVVINILFEDMGYKEQYDAVTGIFPIRTKQRIKSRFVSFSEYQICIKNTDIISSIECINSNVAEKDYKSLITKYNHIKFGKTNLINSRTKTKYKSSTNIKYNN